jgi:hypothetical protein
MKKINNMLNNAENLINKNKKEREDMEKEKNKLRGEFKKDVMIVRVKQN